MTKYIFVTGGVVSGLGKGIPAASLGRLLKSRGPENSQRQKLDPYINVDPGTLIGRSSTARFCRLQTTGAGPGTSTSATTGASSTRTEQVLPT